MSTALNQERTDKEKCQMLIRRLAIAALPLVVAASGATLVLSPAAHATTVASSGIKNGTCSKGSAYSLQVQREDTGQVSVDWGVDMARHVAGIKWAVHETRNGITFVNGTVKTISDGSWSITSTLNPQPTNLITATAKNPATGEVCSATVRL
jgi:hypothetical protein